MAEEENKPGKEFSEQIGSTIEKLIRERLGIREGSILWGNELHKKHNSRAEGSDLESEVALHIQARTILEKSDVELGESFHLEIELKNVGKTPVSLMRIEDVIPSGFELVAHSGVCDYASNCLDMRGTRLDSYGTTNLGITLRANQKGVFILAPKVFYTTQLGRQTSVKVAPASIRVSETILPNRIGTGFQDLDNLLLGGIPKSYAVILTSISCDERDLLIKRYIEAGLNEDQVTFYIGIGAASLRSLAEEFQSDFFIFLCNPKASEELGDLPNVYKLGGVENLTGINIGLESVLHNLTESKEQSKRACIEILSDVLLQHGAVQTRRWLSGLIPELRSRGFTTLGVINPRMHASEETHALLDLFEGEITLYEKETQDLTKYIRIRKLYNERYLESELPLRKTRLMTMPLKLSCCTRTFNV
jgi:uncharacterized repeat protein (TIGR01451 family)